MTAKHNSKHARNNLWVAQHRAATAKSDPRKRDHDARQQVILAKTKATRAMNALLASLGTENVDSAVKESEESKSAETAPAAAPAEKDPTP